MKFHNGDVYEGQLWQHTMHGEGEEVWYRVEEGKEECGFFKDIASIYLLQGPTANYTPLLGLYPPSKSQSSQNIYTHLLVSTSSY